MEDDIIADSEYGISSSRLTCPRTMTSIAALLTSPCRLCFLFQTNLVDVNLCVRVA